MAHPVRCAYTSLQQAYRAYAEYEEEAAKHGEQEEQAVQASLGRLDLFYLLTRIIGRRDLEKEWFFARCCEVQAAPDGYLDLWAREHGKSSIITFGLTIQDILRNPEITVGIFSHTRPMAKDFLGQIKYELESNQRLTSCYPDVLWQAPRREAPVWSLDKGIVVRRKGNPKEATVEAWGLVDGQPTGKHFQLLVYDDIVTRESVSNPEMIAKVTECWALSLNLGARGGTRRHIGTRYHAHDTYKSILERKAAKARIYAATQDSTPEGEPVLLSQTSLQKKRREMGPYVFGCQMLLNPTADAAQNFKEEWLRHWNRPSPDPQSEESPFVTLNRYITVDPAGTKKAYSDYTVMFVIGLGADNNWYVIDGIRDRLNLTARAEALFRLHRKYMPLGVGYEKYGMQADIEFMQREQERRNYRFPITELGGAMDKKSRIRKLVPYFETGRIFFPRQILFVDSEQRQQNLTHLFEEEYLSFPVSRHDDMLDCLARILDPELGANFPLSNVEKQQKQHIAQMEYSIF